MASSEHTTVSRIHPLGVLLCLCLLIAGLTLPVVRVDFRLEFYDEPQTDSFLKEIVLPTLGVDPDALLPQSKSVCGTVSNLLTSPIYRLKVLGCLLAFFSIGLPAAKLVHLLTRVGPSPDEASFRWHLQQYTQGTIKTGIFGYVDLLIICLIVDHFSTYPGGTTTTPQIGLFYYWGYLILSNRLGHSHSTDSQNDRRK